MRLRFRLLDVFAEAPFTGNQLCVVPETPPALGHDLMLAITREINFSETTFVTAIRDDGYDVRIYLSVHRLAGMPGRVVVARARWWAAPVSYTWTWSRRAPRGRSASAAECGSRVRAGSRSEGGGRHRTMGLVHADV